MKMDYLQIGKQALRRSAMPARTDKVTPYSPAFTANTDCAKSDLSDKSPGDSLQQLSDGAWFCDGCWTKFWLAEGAAHTCPKPRPGAVRPHTVWTGEPIVLTDDVLAKAEALRQQAAAGRAEYQRQAARHEVLAARSSYFGLLKGYRFTGQPRYFGGHGFAGRGDPAGD
jgi:hypothetical protein